MNKKKQQRQLDIAKECLLEEAKETDEFVEDLLVSYDQAAERLKADIQRILTKFADDNSLTADQANKLLSGKEFSVWKKSIKQYLKDIEEHPEDSKMLIELNTLSAKSRISQKEKLLAEIDKEMSSLAINTNKQIRKHLSNVLVTNYYRGHYLLQKTTRIGFNVSGINHNLVKQIIDYPWSTKKFSKDVWDNIDKLTETLRKELASGVVDGSSLQKIVKRVDDVLGKGKFLTERVVRTESKYFVQQANLLAYKKAGVTHYMYIGAGCDICEPLNGRKWPIDEAEPQVNCPPMHPNCKCRVIAVHELSLFDAKRNVTQLDQNIRFKEWKKKFAK